MPTNKTSRRAVAMLVPPGVSGVQPYMILLTANSTTRSTPNIAKKCLRTHLKAGAVALLRFSENVKKNSVFFPIAIPV